MNLKASQYFAFKIKDGLFIGDINSPNERDFLISNKITHVVNCASSQIKQIDLAIGVKFISFDWLDQDDQIIVDDLDENMQSIFQFMSQAYENHESVLICSVRGQSRALTVITAFLMKRFEWSLYKTLEFMNSRRTDFEIRAAFLKQLLNYEQRLYPRGINSAWKDEGKDHTNEEAALMRNTYLNSQLICVDSRNFFIRSLVNKDYLIEHKSAKVKWSIKIKDEISHEQINALMQGKASENNAEVPQLRNSRQESFNDSIEIIPVVQTAFLFAKKPILKKPKLDLKQQQSLLSQQQQQIESSKKGTIRRTFKSESQKNSMHSCDYELIEELNEEDEQSLSKSKMAQFSPEKKRTANSNNTSNANPAGNQDAILTEVRSSKNSGRVISGNAPSSSSINKNQQKSEGSRPGSATATTITEAFEQKENEVIEANHKTNPTEGSHNQQASNGPLKNRIKAFTLAQQQQQQQQQHYLQRKSPHDFLTSFTGESNNQYEKRIAGTPPVHFNRNEKTKPEEINRQSNLQQQDHTPTTNNATTAAATSSAASTRRNSIRISTTPDPALSDQIVSRHNIIQVRPSSSDTNDYPVKQQQVVINGSTIRQPNTIANIITSTSSLPNSNPSSRQSTPQRKYRNTKQPQVGFSKIKQMAPQLSMPSSTRKHSVSLHSASTTPTTDLALNQSNLAVNNNTMQIANQSQQQSSTPQQQFKATERRTSFVNAKQMMLMGKMNESSGMQFNINFNINAVNIINSSNNNSNSSSQYPSRQARSPAELVDQTQPPSNMTSSAGRSFRKPNTTIVNRPASEMGRDKVNTETDYSRTTAMVSSAISKRLQTYSSGDSTRDFSNLSFLNSKQRPQMKTSALKKKIELSFLDIANLQPTTTPQSMGGYNDYLNEVDASGSQKINRSSLNSKTNSRGNTPSGKQLVSKTPAMSPYLQENKGNMQLFGQQQDIQANANLIGIRRPLSRDRQKRFAKTFYSLNNSNNSSRATSPLKTTNHITQMII